MLAAANERRSEPMAAVLDGANAAVSDTPPAG